MLELWAISARVPHGGTNKQANKERLGFAFTPLLLRNPKLLAPDGRVPLRNQFINSRLKGDCLRHVLRQNAFVGETAFKRD
jgi:hypothetical protein